MRNSKIIGLSIALVVIIGILLALSVNLILARTDLHETIKEKLIDKLCGASGCRIEFEKLEFSLLPTPHVAVSRMRFELPAVLKGTAESLFLAPGILPLLAGRIEPAAVRLVAPRLEVSIPDPGEGNSPDGTGRVNNDDRTIEEQPAKPDQPLNFQVPALGHHSDLQARLISLLKGLTDRAPGLRLQIERGECDLINKARRLISLRDFKAHVSIPPRILTMRIECHSDLWDKFALDAWLDPVESKYGGHLSLDRFRSQALGEYLSASALKPGGESPIDLDATFSGGGSGPFQASFQSRSSSLTLQWGSHGTVIRDAAVEGSLQMTADKLDLQVSSLVVKEPQLGVSGRFFSDPEAQDISYRIEGREINAAAVREAALALFGEHRTLQDVFEIVRGGHVPLVTFEARGRTLTDLQRSENLVVRGSLQQGQVSIPKVKLDADNVYGDVTIADGILEGRNLQATTGDSVGRNGSLTVALTKKNGPFHLDIEIDADLAQLPPILARVVDNKAFSRELALVRDVSGGATGRLILGETLDEVRTRVDVKEWKLKGRYQRFPFPLKLKAKSFCLEGSEITVGGLQGSFGRSEVYDVSGSLNWSQKPELELTSPASGRIALDEFFPWLMTFPSLSNNRWNLQALEGTLLVESLSFKGPLARPEAWYFSLASRLEAVTSRAGAFGFPLFVKSGSLSATPQALEVVNTDFSFLDASLSASGKFAGYMTDQPAADLSFRGTVGTESNEWISNLAGLPPELRLRAPFSTPGSILHWEKGGRVGFSGAFQTGGDAKLSLDLEHAEPDLLLKQLRVEDQDSNATITVQIKPEQVDLSFRGNLSGGTLDRMLARNKLFEGTITGGFTAQIFKKRPGDSTVNGHLSLRDFGYGPVPVKTLTLEDASVEGQGNSLAIKKAAILLQDERLDLKGTVGTDQDRIKLALDLSAKEIAWDRLKALFSPENRETESRTGATAWGSSIWGIPVRGTLRVHAGRFSYNDFAWKPVEAELLFTQEGINLEVMQANLCKIPTPAKLIQHPQGSLLLINLNGRNLDLDSTLSCLWARKGVITGSFDLSGEITANVQPKMGEAFRGEFLLNARNGRVYRSTVLAKTFDLLNVTEIYRGQLPDLMNEGCAYDTITARAALKNGKLLVEDAVFDGRCAKMLWTGEIDLESRKVNFTVLVSPLKTVDRIISSIPMVGKILGDSLVSIPLHVTGDLSDPNVSPFAPSAVDSSLLNTMKKVFRLPFTLMQPLR